MTVVVNIIVKTCVLSSWVSVCVSLWAWHWLTFDGSIFNEWTVLKLNQCIIMIIFHHNSDVQRVTNFTILSRKIVGCIIYSTCRLSQCWSESGLVSPAVSPSPQGQSPSPSPSPSGQSPSPSGASPSPLDQSPSPSPSPLDQSPSPSPVGQSPSPSPRVQKKSEWVQTQAWTHESNNRKVLCFNSTFNHFCWALYW